MNQLYVASALALLEPTVKGRQPGSVHGLSAKCYQHGHSHCPLTGSLSPHPSPTPSVRDGTGNEEGRHWVSGGPGCVLGCSLLLLPPGQLGGLSSHDPSAPSRRAASCNRNKQLVLHDFIFFFEKYLIYRLSHFSNCDRCEMVSHYSNSPSLITSDFEHKNIW